MNITVIEVIIRISRFIDETFSFFVNRINYFYRGIDRIVCCIRKETVFVVET